MKVTDNKSTTATIQRKTEPFFRKEGDQDFFSRKPKENAFFAHGKPATNVQAKLSIGQPGDKYEQEADATADKVVQRLATPDQLKKEQGIQRKPLSADITSFVQNKSNPSTVQAKCEHCEQEEKLQKKEEKKEEEGLKEKLQRKPIFDSDAESPGDETVQRKCAHCEEEEKNQVQQQHDAVGPQVQHSIQKQSGDGQEEQADVQTEQKLNASKGSGTPLPAETKKQMESSMGADFSGVRIHNDGQAADMSKDMNAQAFTHGSDIYFNDGKFNTNTQSGQHLLAHELTHVIQQNGSDVMKKEEDDEEQPEFMETGGEKVQRFGIPFTDYETDFSVEGLKTAGGLVKDAGVWAGSKVKEGAVFIKDKAVEAFEYIVDQIGELVNDGIEWLKGKFNEILEFGATIFENIKNRVKDVMTFITNPIDAIVGAMANMSVGMLETSWALLKNGAKTVWGLVKSIVNGALSFGNGLWKVVSGGIDTVFSKVGYLMNSWAFNKLPDFLVTRAKSIFNRIKTFWEFVRNFWTSIWNQLTAFVENLLASIEQFVNNVISFAIDKVIQTVKTLKEIYDFVKKVVDDPKAALQPYLDVIAAMITTEGPGKSREVAKEKIDGFFGNKPAASTTGVIQKSPSPGPARSTASRAEVDAALEKQLSDQWEKLDIKSMLWESLVTMFHPVELTKAIGREFYDLWTKDWANAAGSLYAPSFESFGTFFHDIWSNILILVEFPLTLIKRLENILMLLMGWVTIILVVVGFVGGLIAGAGALSVPGAFAGAWAGAQLAFVLGEALFLAYILTESTYILKLFADLYTARQTQEEKDRDYKDIAGGVIGMGVALVIVLIFMILSALVKMVVNKIRGPKVEPPKTGEPKTGDPKAEGAPTEAPKLEGEVGSLDGQRSVNITEKGKIWVCASPCEEIRLKYDAEIKGDPKLEERIKKLEDGYENLNAKEKAIRDGQIRQLEQDLADLKAAREGSARVPKELKWPPKKPAPPKPDIGAPDAAEWRYQRYAYEKFLKGAAKKEVLPPFEWFKRYFETSVEGGRPGRPGGPEQVAAKNKLAGEGIRIVENVEVGGRYPDGIDPKPNAKGGKSYFEVGKMLESGIPEARERVKIADEIKAMGPDDTVTFVDKSNTANRATYRKGSTPENPSGRTFTPKKQKTL